MNNFIPCLDVYPPQDFKSNESKSTRALFDIKKLWKPGDLGTITVNFGRYPCSNCNTSSNWSVIGSDSTKQIPSMNISTLDPPFDNFELDGKVYGLELFRYDKRNCCQKNPSNKSECCDTWKPGGTIIHEFCHALGMKHEHQNNVRGDLPFVFHRDKVIRDAWVWFGWSEEKTKTNILNRYSCTANNVQDCPFYGSQWDKYSVMNYALDKSWLKEGDPPPATFELSRLDIEWLETYYPKDIPNKPKISVQFVDGQEWQQKWVEWIVKEKIAPHVGIDFEFIPGKYYPAPAPSNMVDISTEALTGIILGTFSFLVIIIILFF